MMAPMRGHIYLLSPLQEPWAYAAFLLHWAACLICIGISLHFYRAKKGAWWLLMALAFGLPLLATIATDAALGLPPLPHGTAYPMRQDSESTFISTRQVDIYWDTVTPMVAAALLCAFFAEKKK